MQLLNSSPAKIQFFVLNIKENKLVCISLCILFQKYFYIYKIEFRLIDVNWSTLHVNVNVNWSTLNVNVNWSTFSGQSAKSLADHAVSSNIPLPLLGIKYFISTQGCMISYTDKYADDKSEMEVPTQTFGLSKSIFPIEISFRSSNT